MPLRYQTFSIKSVYVFVKSVYASIKECLKPPDISDLFCELVRIFCESVKTCEVFLSTCEDSDVDTVKSVYVSVRLLGFRC